MPTHQDIKGLHRSLQAHIQKELGDMVRIIPPGASGKWQNVPIGKPVTFGFCPTGAWARRERGEEVNVLPLCAPGPKKEISEIDATPHAWIAWFEHWRKQSAREFDLVTAAWTVFLGWVSNPDKAQILRAEWDKTEYLKQENRDAPQPHWHFDQPVPGPSPQMLPQEPVSASGALVEYSPRARVGREPLILSSLHLGMAGWKNRGEPPDCWQMPCTPVCDALGVWARRTLWHLQKQFDPAKHPITPVSRSSG